MKCIFHQVKANIRKNISGTAILLIMVTLVALLLGSGLNILASIDNAFYAKMEALNSLHNLVIMPKSSFKEEYENFLIEDQRIQEYQIENGVYIHNAEIQYGGSLLINCLFLNKEGERNISYLDLLEADDSISSGEAIYLPYYAKLAAGYEIGDKYGVQYKNKDYIFTVAGFFQATDFNLPNGGIIRHYLDAEAFARLEYEIGTSVITAIRLKDIADTVDVTQDFRDAVDVEISAMGVDSIAVDLSIIELVATLTIKALSALFIAFAFILVMISLLMIRFRVMAGIEDNFHNIGALQALGYTNRQIISAIIAEYGIISVLGILLGTIGSMFLTPLIGSVMTAVSGILLDIKSQPLIALLSAALVLALLLLMVLLSSRKLRQLSPVMALKGGTRTHNFRKNHLPFHQGRGSVHLKLGLKNVLMHGKLYAMVGVIIAGISFTTSVVFISYENFVMDQSALLKMSGFEVSEVEIAVANHIDADKMAAELETLAMVRSTSMLDWANLRIDGIDVTGYVSEDYGRMETMSVYAGRMPEWENEIILTGTLSKAIGKTIGDSVSVKAGGIVKEFVVTGLTQTMNNGGLMSCITLAGYHRMVPDYQRQFIYVYLKEGVEPETFMDYARAYYGVINVIPDEWEDIDERYMAAKRKAEEKLSAYLNQYGVDSMEYSVMYNGEIIFSGTSNAYQISKLIDYRENLQTNLSTFILGFSVLMQGITVVSLIVISLILFLAVKSIVNRRRQDFGILKACGYTSNQLMLQLSISFMSVAAIGSLAGAIMAVLFVNPIFVTMFRTAGVSNVQLSTNPLSLLLVEILIIISAFLITLGCSWRIKGISPIELITE